MTFIIHCPLCSTDKPVSILYCSMVWPLTKLYALVTNAADDNTDKSGLIMLMSHSFSSLERFLKSVQCGVICDTHTNG